MALPKYYNAGTASIANGDTALTGAGTAWLNLVKADDRLTVQGLSIRIASVEGNGAATLAEPWPGSSLVADPYEIAITYDGPEFQLRTRQLLEQLTGSLEAIAEGAGIEVDATDPLNPIVSVVAGLADLLSRWTPASTSGPASLELREDADNGTSKVVLKAAASLASDVDFILDANAADLLTRFIRATIAGAASLDLHEDADNGSSRVRVSAPAALSADRTFVLPDVDVTISAFGAALMALAAAANGRAALAASPIVAIFTALSNQPPSSNYATLDTRNSHPVLDFDTTTQETAIFQGVIPTAYNGGGLTVTIDASLTSATSGTLGWDAAFEKVTGLDIDGDSFATALTGTAATVPGTSGVPQRHTIAFTNADIDGLAAGDAFRLRIRRDVANDTAAGDAELISVGVEMT